MKGRSRRCSSLFAFCGIAAASALPGRADAGAATQTYPVQIQVESVCVLTASDLVFPAYPAGSSVDVRTSATFLISCPGASPVEPTPVTMRFSTSSGEFAMTNRASRLVYQLCEDSACALPFAYDVAGGATAVTSDRQTYTIFGRIPRLQSPPAGLTYSQRVTATLTY